MNSRRAAPGRFCREYFFTIEGERIALLLDTYGSAGAKRVVGRFTGQHNLDARRFDSGDQRCGHIEYFRQQIDNVLPLLEDRAGDIDLADGQGPIHFIC